MDAANLKNYFFYLATSVVILAGLKVASEIVIILFLAIFIASIISSLLNFLQKGKVPKFISYLIVLSIISIFVLLMYYIINISLKDFLSNLSSYEQGLNDLIVNSISFVEQYGYTVNKDQIMKTDRKSVV